MTTKTPTPHLTIALCGAALAALSLSACNPSSPPAQSTQASQTITTDATVIRAVPPPPVAPEVPQYNRTAEQEARWQHYQAERRNYQDDLARARAEGRQQQAATDANGQADAFNAGRQVQGHIDQGRIDQARHDVAQAREQAQSEPDPHRRQEMIAQAEANLAAAILGERLGRRASDGLRIDLIGVNSLHQTAGKQGHASEDVRVRVALRSRRREDCEWMLWEVESLLCCGPAGGGGYRGQITPAVVTQSALIERGAVKPTVRMLVA